MGIRLQALGDRLRYHPRSAVTPGMVEQLKGHKAELLAILGADVAAVPPSTATGPKMAEAPPHGAPHDAPNPEAAGRPNIYKAELVTLSRSTSDPPSPAPTDATIWQGALDELEGNPLFPPDVMEALRTADVRWAGGS